MHEMCFTKAGRGRTGGRREPESGGGGEARNTEVATLDVAEILYT